MISWLMGLSFLAKIPEPIRKALIYVVLACAVGLVIYFFILRYGVHEYERGAQEKAVKLFNEMAERKQAEWDLRDRAATVRDAQLAETAKALLSKESQLMAASSALAQARSDMNASLKKELARIQSAMEEGHATVISIPDDQLVGAVRAKSADLAKRK